MKLINGWRISVNYDGEPLRDMYAKRFSIYLFKDREYIPCEAEIEKELKNLKTNSTNKKKSIK